MANEMPPPVAAARRSSTRKTQGFSSRSHGLLRRATVSGSRAAAPDHRDVNVEPTRPDVETLRRVRGEFYSKTPEQRRREAGSNGMAYIGEVREKVGRRPAAESGKKERESSSRRGHGEKKHSHHGEHRRRPHTDEAEYVYGSSRPAERERKHTSRVVVEERSREGSDLTSSSEDCSRSRRAPARSHGVESHASTRHSTRELPERARRKDSTRGHSKHSQESRNDDSANPPAKPRDVNRSASTSTRRTPTLTTLLFQRAHTVAARKSTSARPLSHGLPATMESDKDTKGAASPGSKDRRDPPGLLLYLAGQQAPRPVEAKIECIGCMSDDVPISKSSKLPCEHRMCHKCLKRLFTMSLTDPQLMPPRCCTKGDPIPGELVKQLFDSKFQEQWWEKYHEYTTPDRVYCCSKRCGAWIKPASITTENGRKMARCSKCKTKVCCLCRNKWHVKEECPNDEDTQKFVEIAEKAGWRRCYSCLAMVERNHGCNHMTCRCTAEFCMLCGDVWRTCECPMYGEANPNAPTNEGGRPPPPRRARRNNNGNNGNDGNDGVMAEYLDLLLNLDAEDEFELPTPGHPLFNEIFGIGNAHGHLMNEHYVGRATEAVAGDRDRAPGFAGDFVRPPQPRELRRFPDNVAPPHRTSTRRRNETGNRRTEAAGTRAAGRNTPRNHHGVGHGVPTAVAYEGITERMNPPIDIDEADEWHDAIQW